GRAAEAQRVDAAARADGPAMAARRARPGGAPRRLPVRLLRASSWRAGRRRRGGSERTAAPGRARRGRWAAFRDAGENRASLGEWPSAHAPAGASHGATGHVVPSLAVAVVTFLALAESGLVPSTKAGFFCDDPAISFRFRGDTVSLTTLLATTALAPLLVVRCCSRGRRNADATLLTVLFVSQVWLVEAWGRRPHDFAATESSKTRSEVGARLTAFWYREYLLGLGLVLLVTDFAKLLVGEPRPHFLHTCRPNCTAGHHWWDVLAGAVVGIALGVFTVMVFCRSFTELPVILPNDLLGKDEIVTHENGHMTRAFRSTRHQSVRRLLSSTSSCTGEVTPDEQEMKEPS
ncbi:Uncharacterized protein GBIM_11635, partial [Gryllus bimaculatus]